MSVSSKCSPAVPLARVGGLFLMSEAPLYMWLWAVAGARQWCDASVEAGGVFAWLQ